MTDTRKEDFMSDLQALLNKHNAELEVSDDGGEYGMHLGVCIISFASDPDRTYLEFELPKYLSPNGE